MGFLPVARINLDLLDEEIERLKKLLGPEVVRIKHVFQEDTSGEPAVYFRIIITDLSSRRETLGDVAAGKNPENPKQADPLDGPSHQATMPYFTFSLAKLLPIGGSTVQEMGLPECLNTE